LRPPSASRGAAHAAREPPRDERAEAILAKLRKASGKGKRQRRKRTEADDWLSAARKMQEEESALTMDLRRTLRRWREAAAEQEAKRRRSGGRAAASGAAQRDGGRAGEDDALEAVLGVLPARVTGPVLGERAARDWARWKARAVSETAAGAGGLRDAVAMARAVATEGLAACADGAGAGGAGAAVAAAATAIRAIRGDVAARVAEVDGAIREEEAAVAALYASARGMQAAGEPGGRLAPVCGQVRLARSAARAADAAASGAARAIAPSAGSVSRALGLRPGRGDSAPAQGGDKEEEEEEEEEGRGRPPGSGGPEAWGAATLDALLPAPAELARLARVACETAADLGGGGGASAAGEAAADAEDECSALLRLARRDVRAWLGEWSARCASLGPAEPWSRHGGWSEEERTVFEAAARRGRRGAGAGVLDAAGVSRALRGRTPADVAAYAAWREGRGALVRRVAARLETAAEDAVAAVRRAAEAGGRAGAEAAEAARRTVAAAERDAGRAERLETLAALHRGKAAREAALAAEAEAARAAEAAARAEAEARDERRRGFAREGLERARAAEAAGSERRLAAREAARAEEEAAEAEARALREVRLAAREEVDAKRRQRAAEAAADAREAAAARARALERLKEGLPYAEAVASLEADEGRLTGHTAASRAAAAIGSAHAAFLRMQGGEGHRALPIDSRLGGDGEMEDAHRARLERQVAEQGLYNARGFSAEAAGRGLRSRVMDALGGAGLLGSALAGSLIRRMAAPVPRAMAPQHDWGGKGST